MSPIVERVARVLCTSAGDDPDLMAYPFQQMNISPRRRCIYAPAQAARPAWEFYVNDARAAIRGTIEAIEVEAPEHIHNDPLKSTLQALREAIA